MGGGGSSLSVPLPSARRVVQPTEGVYFLYSQVEVNVCRGSPVPAPAGWSIPSACSREMGPRIQAATVGWTVRLARRAALFLPCLDDIVLSAWAPEAGSPRLGACKTNDGLVLASHSCPAARPLHAEYFPNFLPPLSRMVSAILSGGWDGWGEPRRCLMK